MPAGFPDVVEGGDLLQHPRALVAVDPHLDLEPAAVAAESAQIARAFQCLDHRPGRRALGELDREANRRALRDRALLQPRERPEADDPDDGAYNAPFQNPAPEAIPTAATTQRLAAVVRPRIVKPWRKITPAPRKPIPVTT